MGTVQSTMGNTGSKTGSTVSTADDREIELTTTHFKIKNQLTLLNASFEDWERGRTPNAEPYQILGEMEVIAYEWLREWTAKAAPKDRDWMSDILKSIEERYVTLMGKSNTLWIPSTLKEDEDEIASLWKSIVCNTGNLQIIGGGPFVCHIKAGVMWLLRTERGRTIIKTLNENPSQEKSKLVCIAADLDDKTLTLANFTIDPEQRAKAAPVHSVTCPFFRGKEHSQDHYFQGEGPGVGVGSFVKIGTSPVPYVVGVADEPLYLPSFINLGHELGHAYHNMMGVRGTPAFPPQDYPQPMSFEQLCWPNPEEFKNIKENENALRRQHGLPPRKYHVDFGGFERAKRDWRLKEELWDLDRNQKLLTQQQVEMLHELQVLCENYQVKSVEEPDDIDGINLMIETLETGITKLKSAING